MPPCRCSLSRERTPPSALLVVGEQVPRVGLVIGSPGGFGDDWASLSAEFHRATAAGLHTIWLTQPSASMR